MKEVDADKFGDGSLLEMENYVKGELLGMGTYGKVIKVVHKEVSL